MRGSFLRALLIAVPLAAAMAACSDTIHTSTPTEPSSSVPEPVLVTETFAGSVSQGTNAFYVINASVGTVTLTMTGIGPDPSATMGMSIGVLNQVACNAVMDNPKAQIGSQLVGTATGITTICIRLYDAGTITADVPFTFEISIKYLRQDPTGG